MLICQKLSYSATVVDDLVDDTYQSHASMEILEIFKKNGVRFIKADAFTDDLASVAEAEFDDEGAAARFAATAAAGRMLRVQQSLEHGCGGAWIEGGRVGYST